MFKHIFFLFTTSVLNIMSIFSTNYIAEKYIEKPYETLPDIIMKNTKPINVHVPDYVMILILSYILCFENILYNHTVLTYCYFIRFLTLHMTIFPSPLQSNKNIRNTIIYKINSTHDLMFSGHTIMFMYIGDVFENNIINFVIKYLFPILMVLSRQHYTIDIFVSMIVYNYIKLYLETM